MTTTIAPVEQAVALLAEWLDPETDLMRCVEITNALSALGLPPGQCDEVQERLSSSQSDRQIARPSTTDPTQCGSCGMPVIRALGTVTHTNLSVLCDLDTAAAWTPDNNDD